MINKDFLVLVEDFYIYLNKLKQEFDSFDDLNSTEQNRLLFLKNRRKFIFSELDEKFKFVWDYVGKFDDKEFDEYKAFFLSKLRSLLLDPIQINKYIFDKPLGQPGDHIMLSYIYDYYGESSFLGTSTYQKLINNYTCNIPIAYSNNLRKAFFKHRLLALIKSQKNLRILSFGCGAAREIIEILREKSEFGSVKLLLLDANRVTIQDISSIINPLLIEVNESISIEYLQMNYIDIFRKNNLEIHKQRFDYIYCPGIFDYLSIKMAKKMTESLFNLLKPNCKLTICNANKNMVFHRAYYEMIGDWVFLHRDKEEMFPLIEDIKDKKDFSFEVGSLNNCYTYLDIIKL